MNGLNAAVELLLLVGLILWCGGTLAQTVVGAALDPDVKRLEHSLDILERLASSLAIPGAIATALAKSALLALRSDGIVQGTNGPEIALLGAALGATTLGHSLVRKAARLCGERRENLGWERESARALWAWRMLTSVTLASLTALLVMSNLRIAG